MIHKDVLGEVPLDCADAQAPSLLVLEELVEGDGTKAVHIDLGQDGVGCPPCLSKVLRAYKRFGGERRQSQST